MLSTVLPDFLSLIMPELTAMQSPYADILAQRDTARLNRVAPTLSIPARVRDIGAPSTRALDARNARIAEAVAEANRRDAMLQARGDYRPLHGYEANPFTTTSRER